MRASVSIRLSVSLAVVLMLAACAVQGVRAAQGKEASAWNKAASRWNTECAPFTGDGKRELALQNHKCKESIIRAEVLPVALYPDLVFSFLKQSGAVAAEYQNGKVSREKANAKVQALLFAMAKKRDQRMSVEYEQAAASDRQRAKAFSAGFNSSFAAPQAQPVQQPQMRTVNCTPVHPQHPDWGVNCSSW